MKLILFAVLAFLLVIVELLRPRKDPFSHLL